MILRGETAHEILKHQVKTILRFAGLQFRHRRLFADDQLDFRNHVDDDPPVRAEGIRQFGPPARDLRFRLGQQLTHQTAKRLNQRIVRNVALELIEFAVNKITAPACDRSVNFVHEGRLTDAGKTGYERHFGGSGAHTVEGGEQLLNFRVAPVQLL